MQSDALRADDLDVYALSAALRGSLLPSPLPSPPFIHHRWQSLPSFHILRRRALPDKSFNRKPRRQSEQVADSRRLGGATACVCAAAAQFSSALGVESCGTR